MSQNKQTPNLEVPYHFFFSSDTKHYERFGTTVCHLVYIPNIKDLRSFHTFMSPLSATLAHHGKSDKLQNYNSTKIGKIFKWSSQFQDKLILIYNLTTSPSIENTCHEYVFNIRHAIPNCIFTMFVNYLLFLKMLEKIIFLCSITSCILTVLRLVKCILHSKPLPQERDKPK